MAGRDQSDLQWAYRILELETPASRDDLRRAYRLLQMVWHPDRFGDNHANRTAAEAKCRDLNRAWEILGRGEVDPPVPKDRRETSRPAPAAEPEEKPHARPRPRPNTPPQSQERGSAREAPRNTSRQSTEPGGFVDERAWFARAPVLVVAALFAAIAYWVYVSAFPSSVSPVSSSTASSANSNTGQVAVMNANAARPAKPANTNAIPAPSTTGAPSGGGETFRHEEGGLSFVLPKSWKFAPEGDQGIITSPDDTIAIFVMISDERSLDAAVKSIDKEIRKNIQSVRITNEAREQEVNGMPGFSIGGTGTTGGEYVEWSVDIIQAKKPVIFLSVANEAGNKKYAADFL